ncbi:hypothetical protein F140042L4_20190 [Coprococcus phoceensis]
MKYKVGEKVRIRKDLRLDEEYDGIDVNGEMVLMRDEEVTISEVLLDDNGYEIEEDEGYFLWTDSMFEMTNADKIRNMKDEELADFLKETVISCRENLFLCRECNKYGKCSTALKDCTNFITWLQSLGGVLYD